MDIYSLSLLFVSLQCPPDKFFLSFMVFFFQSFLCTGTTHNFLLIYSLLYCDATPWAHLSMPPGKQKLNKCLSSWVVSIQPTRLYFIYQHRSQERWWYFLCSSKYPARSSGFISKICRPVVRTRGSASTQALVKSLVEQIYKPFLHCEK